MAEIETGDFNDWATETTQKALKKVLEDKLKNYDAKKVEELLKKIEVNTKALKGKGAGGSGGASGIDFTKAVKGLDLKGAPGGGGGGPLKSVAKLIGDKFPGATPGGAGGGGGPIGIDNKKAGKAKELAIEAVKKTTSGLFNFGKSILKSTIGIIGFTAIMGSLGRYVGNSIDSYRELVGAGHDFGGSLLEMRKSAADAGMGFDTFTKTLVKHSAVVKMVGTGEFLRLQKNVRRMGREFGQFGLTVEGTSDFLATYLETSVRLGGRQKVDDATRTLGFKSYMNQLTALSKATGIQREELAKAAKEMGDNKNIRMAMNLMTKKDREEFSKVMTTMGPKMRGFGEGMTGLINDAIGSSIAYGNIGMSDLGKIAAIASAETAAAMESLTTRIRGGGDDANIALAELARLMRGDEFVTAVGKMERAGLDSAIAVSEGAGKWMHTTDELANKTLDQVEMTQKRTNEIAAEIAAENAGSIALQNVQSNIRDVFGKIESNILNILAPTLELLGTMFSDFMKMFEDDSKMFDEVLKELSDAFDLLVTAVFGPIEEIDIKGMVEEMIKGLTKFVKYIADPVIPILKTMVENWEWLLAGFIAFKAIGGLVSLITFIGSIVGMGTVFTAIGTALGVAGTAIGTAFAAVTLPIWGTIAAFVAIGAAIWYFWDDIKEIGGAVWDWMGEIGTKIAEIDWFEMFADALSTLFNFFKDLPGMIWDMATDIIPSPSEALDSAGDAISGAWNSVFGDDEEKVANAAPGSRSRTDYEIPNAQFTDMTVAQARQSAKRYVEGEMEQSEIQGIGERAKAGDDYSEYLLQEMKLANKLALDALTQRQEQIKQTKKLQQEDYSMESP